MALNLVYPLKKGTYKRVRGFASHVKHNPGTWYGIDDGCVKGTTFYAPESGRVSYVLKQNRGGGWNFRLNLTKYPGWFMWFAHCSTVPPARKYFKRGQALARSGTSGGANGYVAPHLHWSLMQGSTPRDPDNKNVVKWKETTDMYAEKPKKYSDGKSRSAKSWFNAFVTEYKRKVSARKTSTDLSSQLVTKKKHIKILQTDEKKAIKIISDQSILIDDFEEEVIVLKEQLKSCQHASETTTDTKKGGGSGMLEGKKTYIVVAVLILSAIGQYFAGDITLSAAVTLVLGSLGLGALRRGIENK